MLFQRTSKQIEPTKCFVLMPFKDEYDEIYQEIIKPIVQELGFSCLRADEIYRSTAIMQDIWENIQISGLIIADMTDRNANVFYELGLAHAIGKEVILITQSISDVPFDLRHLRCVVYSHSLRGLRKLADNIRQTIVGTPTFARLPVEFLTDRFLNRFQSREIEMSMEFGPNRGQRTAVSELYLVPPRTAPLPEYYKKIQVAGRVTQAESDHGEIDIKTLFHGMYLISARFSPALPAGQENTFTIKYVLEKCFPEENEFWFFNADSLIERFIARFVFPRASNVRDFRVLEKTESEEKPFERQSNCKVEGDTMTFVWEVGPINPPTCCMFRWKWD